MLIVVAQPDLAQNNHLAYLRTNCVTIQSRFCPWQKSYFSLFVITLPSKLNKSSLENPQHH